MWFRQKPPRNGHHERGWMGAERRGTRRLRELGMPSDTAGGAVFLAFPDRPAPMAFMGCQGACPK
jgi:hypothetical protein